MKHLLLIAPLALALLSAPAFSDPIEGNWKRPTGVIVAISKCGGKFCATAKTGVNAGKSVGSFAANGKGYAGSLTDPAAGKTYTGKASISGATMKMSGCVLGGLICKSENWARQ
jgi:uncharacterized protein (DUF2147 family)